jgi:hypothetical protein
MRTIFSEMHLFNDDGSKQQTYFMSKGKECGVGKIEKGKE